MCAFAVARYQGVVNHVPPEDIMKQLWLRIKDRWITVLHGPEGCGKTTTALLLAHYCLVLEIQNVRWFEPSDVEECSAKSRFRDKKS